MFRIERKNSRLWVFHEVSQVGDVKVLALYYFQQSRSHTFVREISRSEHESSEGVFFYFFFLSFYVAD
jgi:hypothetical protein